jgi:hypothetical protein
MADGLRIYVAGPMRGIEHFNFPAFDAAAEQLRALGHEVFNPADHDRAQHGDDVFDSPSGDLDDIAERGFDLRAALAADTAWICEHADGVALLPGWENSKGASAEAALGRALGLLVEPLAVFVGGVIPPQRRETAPVVVQVPDAGEVRSVAASGAEKGVKLERFDLIPAGPLRDLARHYGVGSRKYADRNWERGYEWSKSFAALQRHIWAFWGGEDIDEETGSRHVIAAAWHCFLLSEFATTHPELDDRP